MNLAPFMLYLITGVFYAVHFTRRSSAVGRAASMLLVGAALVHTFVIGMATMQTGYLPFAGATQAISTFVWQQP